MLKRRARRGHRGMISDWPMAGSWSLAPYPRSYRPVSRCNADLLVRSAAFRLIPSAGANANIGATAIFR